MKKIALALALTFGTGLVANTVFAASNEVVTVVNNGDKDKKKKDAKAEAPAQKTCAGSSAAGKPACCAGKTATPTQK